jgi:tyrosyl-tRNA synthetase
MGFDPSAPDLTLGHAVGLRKLRQLQELGHTVVIIVGDWTARIGDPSGQSKTRPVLSEKQVDENAETYLKQFFRIVDAQQTEVRRQSEWFNGFKLSDVVLLAAQVTVAQMLERGDFAKRFRKKKPISMHEFLYPLLQAYDSIEVRADVEFGGTDQTFNLMLGRQLQRAFKKRPQMVFTVPLLVGTDGRSKMSKSLGNYIALEDPPGEMFGKLMSMPDKMIVPYFELLTNVSTEHLSEYRRVIARRSAMYGIQKRDLKVLLARTVVEEFHGYSAALLAEEEFNLTFGTRTEHGVDTAVVPSGTVDARLDFEGRWEKIVSIPQLLASCGAVKSLSEGRRLVRQRAITIQGTADDPEGLYARLPERVIGQDRTAVSPGMLIRVGKHRFLRVVDAGRA